MSIRWREFRLSIMPGLVIALTLFLSVLLWKSQLVPATLVGRVETIQANVVSTKAGALMQMNVVRFQKVNAGDPVATVLTTDHAVLKASLELIEAEVGLLQVEMTPVDTQRNAINYEQLRLDLMRQRVELASARANLNLAEAELARAEQLHREKLVSDSNYDTAKAERDDKSGQVQEQLRLIAEIEASLSRLGTVQDTLQDSQKQVRAAMDIQEKKIALAEAEASPLVLTAPIEGLVSLIHRHNGENISAGEPIITISASHTDHIVGYLRQPLPIEPRTNMEVRIRTRGPKKEIGFGRILSVGAHLQPINDALLPPTRFDLIELGFPILVSMPFGLSVHPGEFVDLTILPGVK